MQISRLLLFLLWLSYLLVIIYIPHFIRSWSFNRYEAVTFESCAVCLLLSIMLIWRFGFHLRIVLISLAFLLMFIGISYAQWHFYMVLQANIKEAFNSKKKYMKSRSMDTSIVDALLTMASVAIMPTFSSFIEESKLFNNPGNIIGLIKSIMKRQRFQEKKYQMRECFSESLNLIGPCKPGIDNMIKDYEHVIPAAIHAKDLALNVKDEKKGLFWFDVLGFGAAIITLLFLIHIRQYYKNNYTYSYTPYMFALLIFVSSFFFILLVHLLRHYAFARYESIGYELSFTSMVIASFRVMEGYLINGSLSSYGISILVVVTVLFLIASFRNRSSNKKLHKRINDGFNKILYLIPLETETNRVKRCILQNLMYICEWAIVPFSGNNVLSKKSGKDNVSFMNNDTAGNEDTEEQNILDKLRDFKRINLKKQEMPLLVKDFTVKIITDIKYTLSESDFILSDKEKYHTSLVIDMCGISGFLLVTLCILTGWL